MAVNRYRAGRRVEYLAIEELREAGLQAVRTAGSHGPFDVMAWSGLILWLIQVKAVSDRAEIGRAVRESEVRFAAAKLPIGRFCLAETWVRVDGKFDVYEFQRGLVDRSS